MHDRVPTPGRENRVKITQDDGTVISGVLAYADDATQEGSAYTKGNVLPDDVCWLMNLDFDESEPDDAFRYLALMNATVYGGIVIRVISNGLPLSGIAFSVTGTGNVTTDAQGYVFLRKPPGSYTASFTSTLDLVFSPASFRVTATAGKINSYTVEADEASVTQRTFTSSTTINFSSRVDEFDVFCVGGGGSGAAGCYAFNERSDTSRVGIGCTGGAGGFTSTKTGVKNIANSPIDINIGAGGASAENNASGRLNNYEDILSGTPGNKGGTTTVSFDGETICSAAGGDGGNYKTQKSFNSFYCMVTGADGGSGSGGIAGYGAIGASGGDGADGGSAELLDITVNGGKGQGGTTTPFGSGSGVDYSPAGAGIVAFMKFGGVDYTVRGRRPAGAGNSTKSTVPTGGTVTGGPGTTRGAGGGAAIAETEGSTLNADITAISGKGAGGIVIIRWRCK